MKNTINAGVRCLAASVLAATMSLGSLQAVAQGTLPEGDYAAVFKGKTHYTDRQPGEVQVVEQASLRITSSGDALTIEVGQIGSAMSATRFVGTSGNGKFVAIHSVPGRENQAKLIWGELQSSSFIRGTLLYPRIPADGLVPGFTELEFEARPGDGSLSGNQAGNPTPANRRPGRRIDSVSPSVRPSSAPSLSKPGTTIPSTSSAPSTQSAGSTSGAASPGIGSPLPEASIPAAGNAIGGPLGSASSGQATNSAGSSVVSGTITGDTGVVLNVELVDENESTVQSTTLDRSGNYRFENIAAGTYWIFVNDGRAEAYITTTRGDIQVEADGRSSYRVDFNVDN